MGYTHFRPFEKLPSLEVKLANELETCLQFIKEENGSHRWTYRFWIAAIRYLDLVMKDEIDDVLGWLDVPEDVGFGVGGQPL